MAINSRDDKSLQKGPTWHGNANYKPAELTEEFVREYAAIMSQTEMAAMFCISRPTLMEKFGEAYEAGKAAHKAKRRKQLEDVITQLAQTAEYNHTHPEAKTNEFLKAMTLWMKRYDNLDQKVEAQVDDTPTDADPREIVVKRPTREDM